MSTTRSLAKPSVFINDDVTVSLGGLHWGVRREARASGLLRITVVLVVMKLLLLCSNASDAEGLKVKSCICLREFRI